MRILAFLFCPSSRFICRSRKHRTVTHTPSKNAKSPMTMYPKAAPPPYMLAAVSKPE